jgi:hypothetical protein
LAAREDLPGFLRLRRSAQLADISVQCLGTLGGAQQRRITRPQSGVQCLPNLGNVDCIVEAEETFHPQTKIGDVVKLGELLMAYQRFKSEAAALANGMMCS